MDAAQQPSRGSPYLLVEDVARRLRCSTRTIHELTRTNSIPHRRLPGSRRCLFRADELEAWENGATLEIRGLPRGGKIVSPLPGPFKSSQREPQSGLIVSPAGALLARALHARSCVDRLQATHVLNAWRLISDRPNPDRLSPCLRERPDWWAGGIATLDKTSAQ